MNPDECGAQFEALGNPDNETPDAPIMANYILNCGFNSVQPVRCMKDFIPIQSLELQYAFATCV